jgi:hypothetical protein
VQEHERRAGAAAVRRGEGGGHPPQASPLLPARAAAGPYRHLVEADTRFEQPPSIPAGTFRWGVSGRAQAGRWDLWSMAAHESGHALGLAHATTSRDNWLTMSPVEYLNSTRWKTLGRGDTRGLRALCP